MARKRSVAVDSIWSPRSEDRTLGWRVTKVTLEDVHITGPGPCRSYRYIPFEEFVTEWVQLKKVSTNDRTNE